MDWEFDVERPGFLSELGFGALLSQEVVEIHKVA